MPIKRRTAGWRLSTFSQRPCGALRRVCMAPAGTCALAFAPENNKLVARVKVGTSASGRYRWPEDTACKRVSQHIHGVYAWIRTAATRPRPRARGSRIYVCLCVSACHQPQHGAWTPGDPTVILQCRSGTSVGAVCAQTQPTGMNRVSCLHLLAWRRGQQAGTLATCPLTQRIRTLDIL